MPPGNGASIDGYKVDILTNRRGDIWRTQIENTNDPNPRVTVLGLDGNHKVQFKVAAHNSQGYGKDSDPTAVIQPETLFVTPYYKDGGVIDGALLSFRSLLWNTFVAAPWRVDDELAKRDDVGLTEKNGVRQWTGKQLRHATLDATRFKLVEVTEGWYGIRTYHRTYLSVGGKIYARQVDCGMREPMVCLGEDEKFQMHYETHYLKDQDPVDADSENIAVEALKPVNATYKCPSGGVMLKSRSGKFLAVVPPSTPGTDPALSIVELANSEKVCFALDLVNPSTNQTQSCGQGHTNVLVNPETKVSICHRFGKLDAPPQQMCFPAGGGALEVNTSRTCVKTQVHMVTPYLLEGRAHNLVFTASQRTSTCTAVDNETVNCESDSSSVCLFGCHRMQVYIKNFGRIDYPCHYDTSRQQEAEAEIKQMEATVKATESRMDEAAAKDDEATVNKLKVFANEQRLRVETRRQEIRQLVADSGALPQPASKLLFHNWTLGKQIAMPEPGSPDFLRPFCCYSSCLATRNQPSSSLEGLEPLESKLEWLSPHDAYLTEDQDHWRSSPGNKVLIDGSKDTNWCTSRVKQGEFEYVVFDFQTRLSSIQKFGYTTEPNSTHVPALMSLERADELVPGGGGGWKEVIQFAGNQSLSSQEFDGFSEVGRYWRLVVKASHGQGMCINSIRFFGQRYKEQSPWTTHSPGDWLQEFSSTF